MRDWNILVTAQPGPQHTRPLLNGLRASFDDPDTIVVAETIGERCGLAFLTRAMRRRYPFVQPR